MRKFSLFFLSLCIISCSNNEQDNTPNVTIPELTTSTISNINLVSASSGGNIISDGGSSITARGVIWSTSQNPTIALSTKTSDGTDIGDFYSQIINLLPNTTYFVRAYATNSVGTAYGNEVSFITGAIQLPFLSATQILNITSTTASSAGNIISNGGGNILEKGVVWSTSQNPTIALNTKIINGSGMDPFQCDISGLLISTTYYVRTYATNSAGTAYGNQISFTTTLADYPQGTVHCTSQPTVVANVTNPITGRTWMDRNLGAQRVAVSPTDALAYGDLYQWGRRADGHQCRGSATTTVLSSIDQPAHGSFIKISNQSPYDWRTPQNNNLWQGVNGVNNPCPVGYRLPTNIEFEAEINSWNNNLNPFTSVLKLTSGGGKNAGNGLLDDLVGFEGSYWTSTINSNSWSPSEFDSYILEFGNNGGGNTNKSGRAMGHSVRCIKN
jgi:uncharacterized protein (TIGR02145 family)